MAIFNREYLEEKYVSKYAAYLDDDDDKDDDSDDEEDDEDEKKEEPSEKKKSSIPDHLGKDEIQKIIDIIKVKLNEFPKLKKCCDFVDLSDKENIDDDGRRVSSYDIYYSSHANAFIKLVDGDAYSGYPDYKGKDEDDYEHDVESFVKQVNQLISEKKIPAKFSTGKDKEDDAISFGVRSTKMKED